MSDSAYDSFLDQELENYYEGFEEDLETEEWDGPYPEDNYYYED